MGKSTENSDSNTCLSFNIGNLGLIYFFCTKALMQNSDNSNFNEILSKKKTRVGGGDERDGMARGERLGRRRAGRGVDISKFHPQMNPNFDSTD